MEGFTGGILTSNMARYGYRRINWELRRTEIVVSEKRVPEVMHALELQAKGAATRWKRARPIGVPGGPRINLLQRVSAVAKRNTLWVGGITCSHGRGMAMPGGRHRRVVEKGGRLVHVPLTPTDLAIDAIEQAVGREHPGKGLVFQDNQGVQYTSRAFQQCLERHGISQSVVTPGQPVRRRHIGILLQNHEKRTHQRSQLSSRTGGTTRYLQIHRAVL